MSEVNPAVILYDSQGRAHAVQDGVLIPVNTPGLLVAGRDSTDTTRFFLVADDGKLQVGAPTLETIFTGIKDTDGIKKILDPLPAGTNTLGKVDQGAASATAWPTADAGIGTDGASPPSIAGTGVRGWLRAIYERTDIATSVLRDAITGVGGAAKTLADVVTSLTFLLEALRAGRKIAAVTPGTTDLAIGGVYPRQIYVGTGGSILILAVDDSVAVQFDNVASGSVFSISAKQIQVASPPLGHVAASGIRVIY